MLRDPGATTASVTPARTHSSTNVAQHVAVSQRSVEGRGIRRTSTDSVCTALSSGRRQAPREVGQGGGSRQFRSCPLRRENRGAALSWSWNEQFFLVGRRSTGEPLPFRPPILKARPSDHNRPPTDVDTDRPRRRAGDDGGLRADHAHPQRRQGRCRRVERRRRREPGRRRAGARGRRPSRRVDPGGSGGTSSTTTAPSTPAPRRRPHPPRRPRRRPPRPPIRTRSAGRVGSGRRPPVRSHPPPRNRPRRLRPRRQPRPQRRPTRLRPTRHRRLARRRRAPRAARRQPPARPHPPPGAARHSDDGHRADAPTTTTAPTSQRAAGGPVRTVPGASIVSGRSDPVPPSLAERREESLTNQLLIAVDLPGPPARSASRFARRGWPRHGSSG